MLPPNVPNWVSAAAASMHLNAQIPTSNAQTNHEIKRSISSSPTTTTSSPSPTPPPSSSAANSTQTTTISSSHHLSDPDAPLNLSKPKYATQTHTSTATTPTSAPNSPHNYPVEHHAMSPHHQMMAPSPKFLSSNLVMPRAFLPYATALPPHMGGQSVPMPVVDGTNGSSRRHGTSGGSIKQERAMSPSAGAAQVQSMLDNHHHPHFPFNHMYGLPTPPHLVPGGGGPPPNSGNKNSHREDMMMNTPSKEEADFMAACQSEYLC